MFIKKIGYLLLVRLKIFQVLAKGPLLMLLSVGVLFAGVGLKEEYKFQEPSLKTKLYDVDSKNSVEDVNYVEGFGGVRYARIEGVLDNECILITFPSQIEQSQEIKNIHRSYQGHKAKSVVLLSYRDTDSLQSFFQWYFNPELNLNLSFGVIRAGLNIQIQQAKSQSGESVGEQPKDKAYLKLYSSTLHPDLDYFQALKELLQKLSITWSPCEAIHKSQSLKFVKRSLTFLQGLINKEKQLKLFYDHVLCEFNEHLHDKPSPHSIMMKNGFQAASVKFVMQAGNQKKVEKFVISFVNEFGMQEDHLHSANTFYYPISKGFFAPLTMVMYPSIVFFVSLVVYLLNLFIKSAYRTQLRAQPNVLLAIYVMIEQYYLYEDYTYSLCFGGLLLLISIVQELRSAFIGDKKLEVNSKLYEIGLVAIQGLISIYFGVFCFSLSLLSILLSLIMLLKPKSTVFRPIFKLTLLLLVTLFINQVASFSSLYSDLQGFSPQLNLILIIPLVYYSI